MKNKFEIIDSLTKVYLSSKDGTIVTTIDTKSLEILNDFEGTFRAVWNNDTRSFYVMGYDMRYGKNKNIMMHRWIMCAQDKTVVDHLNHDTLDNRKINLLVTSQSNNMFNLDPRKLQGRITGVWWVESRQKWRVKVSVGGKQKHIGIFIDKAEAVKALEDFRKTM